MLMTLAWNSLKSRRKSVLLTFLSLLISISVLFSVEHIRTQAKESFNRTISDVDLIVGAPSGQLNLLLYSVFRMGSPTNAISYNSFSMLEQSNQVSWAIPIALGDSHKGFRVVGTNQTYFEHYRYGNKQPLSFDQGKAFADTFDVVIGSDVARKLNYKIGDEIVIAHGIGNVSFTKHDKTPFKISGILAATGTPVDKSVHVSLEGIEAMHLPPSQLQILLNAPNSAEAKALIKPRQLSAILLGLTSKFALFNLQRQINDYRDDRLMAVLPGVALTELWQLMGSVENLLRGISLLVLLASLFGLSTMLLSSMNERKNEIAVLRVLGAGPGTLFSLVILEAMLLVVFAILSATALVTLVLYLSQHWISARYGLFLDINLLTPTIWFADLIILIATFVTSLLPAIEAYQNALHTRLSAR